MLVLIHGVLEAVVHVTVSLTSYDFLCMLWCHLFARRNLELCDMSNVTRSGCLSTGEPDLACPRDVTQLCFNAQASDPSVTQVTKCDPSDKV